LDQIEISKTIAHSSNPYSKNMPEDAVIANKSIIINTNGKLIKN
jgi:hypothetical protein